ncbi:MAG: DUF2442 domain-containing protein [Magnetococcales bacterium]|nr:DUF2442 domain-containing protein [Magnetococcales bacterium]
MAAIINIIVVEQVGDFRLRLQFDDNTEQIVDFYPFLSHARHPAIRAWLDPVRFATFRLEYGELVWGDYDLCFPIIDLYYNQLEHHPAMESVA